MNFVLIGTAKARSLLAVIFLLAIGLPSYLLMKHITNSVGLPKIEQNVDLQLKQMLLDFPSLKGVTVGRRTRAIIIGNNSPYNGTIYYQSGLDNSNGDLVVFWLGDSTNCQITKIEWENTDTEPKILWNKN